MAAARASLQRSGGGGAVTWGRRLLGGSWEWRCFSSYPAVPTTTPTSLLLIPPSPVSSSSSSSSFLLAPELRPQLVLPGMLPFGTGSMDLMAVPKKKVSPYKKGLRNGPKALKPVPVIVRCKSCGRVKLPHFYCCSGDRGSSGKGESTS